MFFFKYSLINQFLTPPETGDVVPFVGHVFLAPWVRVAVKKDSQAEAFAFCVRVVRRSKPRLMITFLKTLLSAPLYYRSPGHLPPLRLS